MMREPAAGWWQLLAYTNSCDAVKRPQKHSGLRQTDKTAHLLLDESDQTATLFGHEGVCGVLWRETRGPLFHHLGLCVSKPDYGGVALTYLSQSSRSLSQSRRRRSRSPAPCPSGRTRAPVQQDREGAQSPARIGWRHFIWEQNQSEICTLCVRVFVYWIHLIPNRIHLAVDRFGFLLLI